MNYFKAGTHVCTIVVALLSCSCVGLINMMPQYEQVELCSIITMPASTVTNRFSTRPTIAVRSFYDARAVPQRCLGHRVVGGTGKSYYRGDKLAEVVTEAYRDCFRVLRADVTGDEARASLILSGVIQEFYVVDIIKPKINFSACSQEVGPSGVLGPNVVLGQTPLLLHLFLMDTRTKEIVWEGETTGYMTGEEFYRLRYQTAPFKLDLNPNAKVVQEVVARSIERSLEAFISHDELLRLIAKYGK